MTRQCAERSSTEPFEPRTLPCVANYVDHRPHRRSGALCRYAHQSNFRCTRMIHGLRDMMRLSEYAENLISTMWARPDPGRAVSFTRSSMNDFPARTKCATRPHSRLFQAHGVYFSGTSRPDGWLFPCGTVNPIPQTRGGMPSLCQFSQNSRATKTIGGNGSGLDQTSGGSGQSRRQADLAYLISRTSIAIPRCFILASKV